MSSRPPARRVSAAGSAASRKPVANGHTPNSGATVAPRRAYDASNRRVLIADDDESIRSLLVDLLADEGYEPLEAATGKEMLEMYHGPQHPALVLMDVQMPDMTGLEALREISQTAGGEAVPIIMMTAFTTASIAIEATMLGAFDYLNKPFDIEYVLQKVRTFFNTQEQEAQMDAIPAESDQRLRDEIIGSSPEMARIFQMIGRAAASDAPVLITGETGAGKELITNVLHKNSLSARGPLVKVNCAALPESLLESELFGHEKGSFTGAQMQHKGSFERANRGTIFLDEIGEMTLSTQRKLLRVLQEKEFERVGGTAPIHIEVRVVAATNRRLEDEVAAGNFREDLFYRLHVLTIHVPPLREHMEDVPLLVQHFLDKHRYGTVGRMARITPDAMEKLMTHSWPGNIRELENTVQRGIVLSQGGLITAEQIQFAPQAGGRLIDITQRVRERTPLTQVLSEVERELIVEALKQHEGDRVAVAQSLGLELPDLTQRLHDFGLDGDYAAD
jgi:two-component system, NtrC family, response regulator AtoC